MASKTSLVTLMPIRQMSRAITFYTKKLGAKLVYRGDGEMKDSFASVKFGTHEVWLITPEKFEKRTLAYQMLLASNIKSTVAKLQKNGVKFLPATRMSKETRVVGPIAFESWGASAFFKDSEGNVLGVWQNLPPM